MDKNSQEWFVAERARSLALVQLAFCDQLRAAAAPEGFGPAFIAYLRGEDGSLTARQFGIGVSGSMEASDEKSVARLAAGTFDALRRKDYPYPVCHLHFTMRDDAGYLAWVAEPEMGEDGPRLVFHHAPVFQRIDDHTMKEIATEIDAWHEAISRPTLAVS